MARMGSSTHGDPARNLTAYEQSLVRDNAAGCSRPQCSFRAYHDRAQEGQPCLQCRVVEWQDASTRAPVAIAIKSHQDSLEQEQSSQKCKQHGQQAEKIARKDRQLHKGNSGSALDASGSPDDSSASTVRTTHAGRHWETTRRDLEKEKRRDRKKVSPPQELEAPRISGETTCEDSSEQVTLTYELEAQRATKKELPPLPRHEDIAKPKPVYARPERLEHSSIPGICQDSLANIRRNRNSTLTHAQLNDIVPQALSTSFAVSSQGEPQLRLPPRAHLRGDDRTELPSAQPRVYQPYRPERSRPSTLTQSLESSAKAQEASDSEAKREKDRRKANRCSSVISDAGRNTYINRGSGSYERCNIIEGAAQDSLEFTTDNLGRSRHGAKVRIVPDE